jgi:hypothetical protein
MSKMTSPDLTGAPYPLVLRHEGEENEFKAVAFSDRDYDAIDRWIQSQVVAIARESLRDEISNGNVTQEQYEEEMAIAIRAALGVSIYEIRGAMIINTPRGVARLAWQMTQKHHPNLKHAEFIPYCRQIENRDEIIHVFTMLNPNNAKKTDPDTEPHDGEQRNGEPHDVGSTQKGN